MAQHTALIVDDEPDIRELLVLTLSRLGLRVDTAANVADAKRMLDSEAYSFCLCDMRLPDGTGLEIIEHVARNHPHVPIAMITAFGSVDAAVSALKAGAFDFVSKPVDLAVLRRLVQSALKLTAERAAEPVAGETRCIAGARRSRRSRAARRRSTSAASRAPARKSSRG
jgi:two-component system, NtrC family, response regulator PilR